MVDSLKFRQSFFTCVLIVLCLYIAGCQRGRSYSFVQDDDDASPNPFSNLAQDALQNLNEANSNEKESLKRIAEAANNTLDDQPLSQALIEELKQMLAQIRLGSDRPEQRMALAQRAIAECLAHINRYVPRPGDTLVGKWEAQASCVDKESKSKPKSAQDYDPKKVIFHVVPKSDVHGKHKSSQEARRRHSNLPIGRTAYSIVGNFEAALQPQENGNGYVNGNWKGTLDDRRKTGALNYVHNTCKPIRPKLVTSQLIAAKKIRQAVLLGKSCLMKALFYMSPQVEALFSHMDDRDARTIQTLILGQ